MLAQTITGPFAWHGTALAATAAWIHGRTVLRGGLEQ